LEGLTGPVAVPVCARGGLAVDRLPELKFQLDAAKCGAEDGGGGLGVPNGRCRRVEAVTFLAWRKGKPQRRR
jgi:hypothetical protein